MTKEAYVETLYQYFNHPFHDGDDIEERPPLTINDWVSEHAGNIQDSDFATQVANVVFQ